MSEYDHVEEERRRRPTPEAKVYLARWSPWIWIVPAIAIFIAGYLVVRYGFFGGGNITVRFADARGLDRYSPVRFRGAKVGTVQKITIDNELKQVVVGIQIDASMNQALRTGTRFWIVEPGLEGGGLSGLLGGTYVGIAPGPGKSASTFQGQEFAPVLTQPGPGRTYILESSGLQPVAVGAPVQFHGIRAGQILGAEYDEAHGVTDVHAFVVERFMNHVTQNTRFWRAGSLDLTMSGGGISLTGASLASILSSPIEFTAPDVLPGAPVASGTHFDLYDSQTQAEAAEGGPGMPYLIFFPGPVNGLAPGSPVQMEGVQVGRVRDVRLRYVPQSATLETPVTIEIDPRKLELPVDRTALDDAMARLVRKGLRATLMSSLILPGAGGVSLEMTGGRNSAKLGLQSNPPIIPASASGSGIEGVLAQIQKLPIQDIASHLQSIVSHVDTLVKDPALAQSLQRLNASLADVQKITRTTSENIGPLVQSLRATAASAQAAAARAQQLLASAPRQNYDLGALIEELTRAADSVRSLADYLTAHPDSLLKGRGK